LLLSVANKDNPFFFQERVGKNDRIFRLIRFKMMNDKKDVHGNLLPDAERLTAVGKFSRRTSLDEIPQLVNVLNGDMSLIAPRPLLVEYSAFYSEQQRRRREVKPGITCWRR
jgi:lipopolysaccharide/colanic/teichoic acid biosynthesis glycosyltransferase